MRTPLKGTKKRPREESGMKRPQKSMLQVDANDGAYEEAKVFKFRTRIEHARIDELQELHASVSARINKLHEEMSMELSLFTPPMKLNKRPREDSCIDSDSCMDSPRKSSFGGVRVKDDACVKRNVFTFCVLLPNGTSVELKMSELRKEIPIEEFIDAVRNQYDLLINQKSSLSQKRRINWEYPDLFFMDVENNKLRIKVDFCDFSLSKWHLLWLHDGSPEPDEYEDMWDLTPDTDLLMELPDDYTCETALADLIDNSLQALWSNGTGERRLISVEMEPGKISIFDSGPGMDGANGNIVKWGKMGASVNRSMREKAVGGEPPYLTPFFGMFGYGGPVATMCLGRRAVVSSKTKGSSKVFMLHMEREALVSASHTENCWKTKGGVRDPFKDEKLRSPHGSFTKVDIFDPKQKVTDLYIRHLRCKLKDVYFPYIQCDEMSGKTSRPIEFQVNGTDLAVIRGGEVAITNLHSCNGPEFTVQLHFSIRPDSSSMACQNQRVFTTADARLKCVYFPIIEGIENIQRILKTLDEYGCKIRESFESFSCVSVRRLGRLLPDTRWGLLPFMEPKLKKGEKAKILKRLCSRVKCFIDTDSGFNPTPHKTDLAHHHPYTRALKNFGNRSPEDEKEVQVEITRDGKKLTLSQLENLYQDWVSEMHDRYDEEPDVGVDEATIIVVSSKIKKLELTSNVLRVHKEIQRKGRRWTAGQNIKVLKGACAGCHNGNVYATLEYIILEGLPRDAPSEARLICRPLGLPENKGCRLSVRESTIDINDSFVFPIRIIDSEKCFHVDDNEWGDKLELFNQKLPASIDLLSHTDCQELEIDGGLPSLLEAGDRFPENIVAVVRPKSFHSGYSSKRLDQKFIVRDNLGMTLEIVKRRASDGDDGECEHVYSVRLPAKTYKGLRGLYIFQLSTIRSLSFQESGIFMFSFSLTEFKNIQFEHVVQVRAPAKVGRWKVSNYDKNELYTVRVGSCFRPLSVVCYDRNTKHIRFESVPKLVIKLISSGKTLAQVRSKKVEITPDKLTMKIKEFFIDTSELDDIRPNYEATLHISTPDEALYVSFKCRVIPATPKRITVHPTELQKQLLPGQIIEELALEVFDEYGNHVKEDESILLRLVGFSFQDGSGTTRGVGIDCIKKVDANGRLDLSNMLKVSRGYGKRVVLSVISEGKVIFELRFQTEIRELRAVQKVFTNCEAGSLLENITFEVIDAEGKVDECIHDEEKYGQSHTLAIKCGSFLIDDSMRYRFRHGRCTIPSIHLPHTEGVVFFQAEHSRYPELKSTIKVYVDKTPQENLDSVTNHEDVENPKIPAKSLSENEVIPRSGIPDKLQSQVAAQVFGKLSNSALISQKVHLEKHQQDKLDGAMNHEDVGNLILSPRRSFEHEQILPVLPSLRVSQVMNETFSQHNSKGYVSPIRDSAPKLEHTNARGGSQDILCSKKNSSMQELEDDLANSAMQKSGHEKNLESLDLSQSQIQQEISQLQAVIGPDLGNSSSLFGEHSTLEQIESRSQSAAAAICKMLEQEKRHQGIVGVVALLGTVESTELSRMLAQYLGEDQMLAIVCRNLAASCSLETLGLSINGGYNAFCLEDIRPKSREPSIDPQELLPLQNPTLPNGNVPQGFLGYAVNLISIEPSHVKWRTTSGHGLRQTLFFRLFGKLQVYKDRDCMMAALPCIKTGAVSLDGGMMRGNGLISLGHWESKILFPVMNKAVCPESLRILGARKLELVKIKQRIDEERDALQRSSEKFLICLNKYNNSYMSQRGAG